jgi:predicted RNA-binding Zn-ribbon protein involved in translation (DUF1610 family)
MTKWVNTKGPWLKDIAPDNLKQDADIKFSEAITFKRPKCPECGNKKKLNCTKVDGIMRYYKCPCGAKFKAIEKDV